MDVEEKPQQGLKASRRRSAGKSCRSHTYLFPGEAGGSVGLLRDDELSGIKVGDRETLIPGVMIEAVFYILGLQWAPNTLLSDRCSGTEGLTGAPERLSAPLDREGDMMLQERKNISG